MFHCTVGKLLDCATSTWLSGELCVSQTPVSCMIQVKAGQNLGDGGPAAGWGKGCRPSLQSDVVMEIQQYLVDLSWY